MINQHTLLEKLCQIRLVYRVKVVSEHMKAGVPLCKIHHLLEAGGHCDSSHLCQLIPSRAGQSLLYLTALHMLLKLLWWVYDILMMNG